MLYARSYFLLTWSWHRCLDLMACDSPFPEPFRVGCLSTLADDVNNRYGRKFGLATGERLHLPSDGGQYMVFFQRLVRLDQTTRRANV